MRGGGSVIKMNFLLNIANPSRALPAGRDLHAKTGHYAEAKLG